MAAAAPMGHFRRGHLFAADDPVVAAAIAANKEGHAKLPIDLPKLIIHGTWETAPDLYRARGGVPLVTCARIAAERIGARLLAVPSAHHYPHVDSPSEVNAVLLEVFATANGQWASK